LYELRQDEPEIQRALAYQLDGHWEANDAELQRLLWRFRVAAWALGIEIVLLLASVGGNLD
jgi:hypothetical protein